MAIEVEDFISEATESGYDRSKLRRCAEERIRSIQHQDEEKFDQAMFFLWKLLKIKFSSSSKTK